MTITKNKIIFFLFIVILIQLSIIITSIHKSNKIGDVIAVDKSNFELKNNISKISLNDYCNKKASLFHEITLGDNAPPLGYCYLTPDGDLESKIYNFDIKTKTTFSYVDSAGRIKSNTETILQLNDTAPKGVFTLLNEWDNKPYPLKIKDEELTSKNEYVKKTISFTPSPIVSISASTQFNNIINGSIGAGVSFLNTGNKLICRGFLGPCNSKYKFLGLVLDYDFISKNKGVKRLGGDFIPVMFNAGFMTKWTTNLYFYPQVGFRNLNPSVGIGLALSL